MNISEKQKQALKEFNNLTLLKKRWVSFRLSRIKKTAGYFLYDLGGKDNLTEIVSYAKSASEEHLEEDMKKIKFKCNFIRSYAPFYSSGENRKF